QAARTEEGIEQLAIGDGGIGSQAAGLVTALVREFLAENFFPENLALLAADGQQQELMAMGDGHIVVRSRRVIVDGLLRLAARDRHGEKNAITKDNWTGMAFARKRDSPTNILLLAPVDGRFGVRRD